MWIVGYIGLLAAHLGLRDELHHSSSRDDLAAVATKASPIQLLYLMSCENILR